MKMAFVGTFGCSPVNNKPVSMQVNGIRGAVWLMMSDGGGQLQGLHNLLIVRALLWTADILSV